MDNTLSLEFTYRSKIYYAIVRTKMTADDKQYFVTIMNANLDRLLYGHHIISEAHGVLRSVPSTPDSPVTELIHCIEEALCRCLVETDLLLDYSLQN